MAYRFLLEVPERLIDQASVAVAKPGDAQVVVVRNSHRRMFDTQYFDLTIAAHSLAVVDDLHWWVRNMGASAPEINVVLHSGNSVAVNTATREELVAAIRTDQPWVERTIPMIGEHEPMSAPAEQPKSLEVAAAPARAVEIRAINHIAIRAYDLEKAERFYEEFLSFDLVGRAAATKDGYVQLPQTFTWAEANRTGQPADVSILRNGPLTLAVNRVGLGARIDRAILDHVSIRVDAATFTKLKSQVLMRSMEVTGSSDTTFSFRDPFFVTWEISLNDLPEFGG